MAANRVIHVHNNGEIDSAIAKSQERLVIVDFSATWCGPCRSFAPTYEKVSNEFPDVDFVHVDIDQSRDHAIVQGISSVPTFQFFKGGKSVSQFSGANEGALRQNIAQHK